MKTIFLRGLFFSSIFLVGINIATIEKSSARGLGEAQFAPSEHTCFDSFLLGNVYINVNCNKCTSQKNKDHFHQSTCKTN